MEIRDAVATDADALAAIYNYYITDTIITFEETIVSGAEMEARRRAVVDARLPWIVAVEGERVVGYAYAGKWKDRIGYRHTVESSVYLAHDVTGRGTGSALYEELLRRLRRLPLHLVIGGVALPNEASVRLHERFGFVKVAHFNEIGRKFDRWIDVGYWQLTMDGKTE